MMTLLNASKKGAAAPNDSTLSALRDLASQSAAHHGPSLALAVELAKKANKAGSPAMIRAAIAACPSIAGSLFEPFALRLSPQQALFCALGSPELREAAQRAANRAQGAKPVAAPKVAPVKISSPEQKRAEGIAARQKALSAGAREAPKKGARR